MSNLKVILIVALAFLLVVPLTACGGQSSETNGAVQPPNSQSPTNTTEPAATVEPIKIPEPTNTPEPTQEPTPEEVAAYEITYTNATLYADSIGSVWGSVIAEVTNTGSVDLYMSSGTIDLEDETGALVDVMNMVSAFPEVISPGEKGYYYETTIFDNVSVESNLKVILHEDIQKAKVEKINFPISDLSLTDESYGGVKATGRVENTSSEDEGLLYIVVFLYGENDTPLGVMFTIADVKAGDKVGFTASEYSLPDEITTGTITRYEAVAYPMQFQF